MQTLSLHHHTAAAVDADHRRVAAEHRHARRVSNESIGAVALRRATFADRVAVSRLAQLDDTDAPQGDLLLAELDGRLVAALPMAGGQAIADPFVRTQEIVELMNVRASALSPATRSLMRRATSGLRHAA